MWKFFEFFPLFGELIVVWMMGHHAIKGKNRKRWVVLYHGGDKLFHICCYVHLSTASSGFLKNNSD